MTSEYYLFLAVSVIFILMGNNIGTKVCGLV